MRWFLFISSSDIKYFEIDLAIWQEFELSKNMGWQKYMQFSFTLQHDENIIALTNVFNNDKTINRIKIISNRLSINDVPLIIIIMAIYYLNKGQIVPHQMRNIIYPSMFTRHIININNGIWSSLQQNRRILQICSTFAKLISQHCSVISKYSARHKILKLKCIKRNHNPKSK
jgi:hypothetical protein